MQSLVICSAGTDTAAADQISRCVRANCSRISVEEQVIVRSPAELLDTVDRTLSADIVILLLSPDTIPTTWSRQQWEPVLIEQPREIGTALAFALVRPCRFPEILRRQNFFDFSSDWRTAAYELRSWLF